MENRQLSITIRPYAASDAKACYDIRRQAFHSVFSQELSPEAVRAGADAYDLKAFGRWLDEMVTYVAMDDEQPIGFCTMRFLDKKTAEILYLYVKLDQIRRGVGSRLIRHVESRIQNERPGISELILDTAVPGYNKTFWTKMGYTVAGKSECVYPLGRVPAVRLRKSAKSMND